MDALSSFLEGDPTFCFTVDVEWSPEWAIAATYELADRFEIPLTPFLTHESAYLRDRLRDPAARGDVGLHPNFLPGSTHGRTVEEVVAAVCELWPDAISYRSHCFYDETRAMRAFEHRGFRYESNLCLFLQPQLAPLRSSTSLTRLPVFWEDDFHVAHAIPWRLDVLRGALMTPGLKIFDMHPLRVALNSPDEQHYDRARHLYSSPDADRGDLLHQGDGTASFLSEVYAFVRQHGLKVVRLVEIYEDCVKRGLTPYTTDGRFRLPHGKAESSKGGGSAILPS